MFFVVPVIAVAQLSVSCISLFLLVIRASRSWVRFSHGALLVLGGRFSPDLQCSGGLSPGPFCVEFSCSPQTFSAQVGYLPGLSVWSLHVLPVFTRGYL